MTTIARRQSTPCTYEASWGKYATARRHGWTWMQPVRQQFRPFATLGEWSVLLLTVPLMLVLFLIMAG